MLYQTDVKLRQRLGFLGLRTVVRGWGSCSPAGRREKRELSFGERCTVCVSALVRGTTPVTDYLCHRSF
jgi:hypothetical protein